MLQRLLYFTFLLCLSAVFLFAQDEEEEEMTPRKPEKPPIKAIVFDFDGVLVHSKTASVEKFLSETFNSSPEETARATKELRTFLAQGGKEKEFWTRFGYAHGTILPSDWYNQLERIKGDSLVEIRGMPSLVKELKKMGYKLVLFANISPYEDQIIGKLGYYELFDLLVLSFETEVELPNPQAYEILLQKTRLPAEQLLFIDEYAENIKGAKAVGINAILFHSVDILRSALRQRDILVKEKS